MKLFFLIFIATLSASSADENHKTFNEVFKFQLAYPKPPEVQAVVLDPTIKSCVEAKLNLAKNGDKVVEGLQGGLLIILAYIQCDDKMMVLNEKLRYFRNGDENISCFKSELAKIDPKSELVKNFVNTENEEVCERVIGEFYKKLPQLVRELRDKISDKKEDFVCDMINVETFKKIVIKNYIVDFGNSDNFTNIERKLAAEVIEVVKSVFDCVITWIGNRNSSTVNRSEL